MYNLHGQNNSNDGFPTVGKKVADYFRVWFEKSEYNLLLYIKSSKRSCI